MNMKKDSDKKRIFCSLQIKRVIEAVLMGSQLNFCNKTLGLNVLGMLEMFSSIPKSTACCKSWNPCLYSGDVFRNPKNHCSVKRAVV